MTKSSLVIVFDLDGTLVSEKHDLSYSINDFGDGKSLPLTARPNLKILLDFVFCNFLHVGIFTASNKDHYNYIYDKILKPILGSNNFSFVWTRDRITYSVSS